MKSFVPAIAVFTAVILIGAVDIASALRAERVRAQFEREIANLRGLVETDRIADENTQRDLRLHLETLDGLARETYGSLKRHAKHPLPRPERGQPTPRFR